MACAIHGPQSCGPECSGYLWPAPDAAPDAPAEVSEAEALADEMLAGHGAPSNVTPEDRAALVRAIEASRAPVSRPVEVPAPAGFDMRAIETMQRRVERYIADMGRTAAAAFEAMEARVARIESQLASLGAVKVEPMKAEPAHPAKSE